jgi:SM-20-related protein
MRGQHKVIFVMKTKNKYTPTLKHHWGGKGVFVFDNLFTKAQILTMSKIISGLPYKRRSSFDNELSYGLPKDHLTKTFPTLLETTLKIIDKYYFSLSRKRSQQFCSHGYGAAIQSKNSTLLHRDWPCDDCVSFLYYGNSDWDPSWGGETIFFDDQQNALFAVNPKPGRLVFFNAGLIHRTGVPMKIFSDLRYGISIFFRCEKAHNDGEALSKYK